MVDVTEAASEEFARYFESRDASPIRIFHNAGG